MGTRIRRESAGTSLCRAEEELWDIMAVVIVKYISTGDAQEKSGIRCWRGGTDVRFSSDTRRRNALHALAF
jgi:hypothetical protein